jgi:hypothetical protein
VARGHAVTPIVEDPPEQHGLRVRPLSGKSGALLAQSALHRLEQLTDKDGLVFTGIDLAAVNDLANVAPVVQEIGEGASGERDAANGAPIGACAHLGNDAAVAQIGQQRPDAADLEIAPEDGSDPLGRVLVDDELLVPALIAERDIAADPDTLALGGRDLVANALAGDLAFELGERDPAAALTEYRALLSGAGLGGSPLLVERPSHLHEPLDGKKTADRRRSLVMPVGSSPTHAYMERRYPPSQAMAWPQI